MNELNLCQKLNEIRKKVEYIRKDKAVETYKAVTHDAVTAETRKWFAEFGVLIVPHEIESRVIEAGKTAKGTAINRFEAKYRVDFINCDEPSQRESAELTAHALDHGDKAPGKAISYAVKYAILKVLQIETGENDEARQTANMAPGEEVDDSHLKGMLKIILEAKTQEDLIKVYKEAYVQTGKDKEAKEAIIAAKDQRKAELAKVKP